MIVRLLSGPQGQLPVCQFNVEFHGHLEAYNSIKADFRANIVGLLEKSDFLPVIVHPPVNHIRACLLGIENVWKNILFKLHSPYHAFNIHIKRQLPKLEKSKGSPAR